MTRAIVFSVLVLARQIADGARVPGIRRNTKLCQQRVASHLQIIEDGSAFGGGLLGQLFQVRDAGKVANLSSSLTCAFQ